MVEFVYDRKSFTVLGRAWSAGCWLMIGFIPRTLCIFGDLGNQPWTLQASRRGGLYFSRVGGLDWRWPRRISETDGE